MTRGRIAPVLNTVVLLGILFSISCDAGTIETNSILGPGDFLIEGDTMPTGDSLTAGDILPSGDSLTAGDSMTASDSEYAGDDSTAGDNFVFGDSYTPGDSLVFGDSYTPGDSFVFGDSNTPGDSFVSGDTIIATEHFVTQSGITWYFDQAYPTGQYANGDFWVMGPVNIVAIDPPSQIINGRVINGSMINPDPLNGTTQGYDSEMYGNYGPHWDATLNAARPNDADLSASNPLVVPINSSLVSSQSDPAPTSAYNDILNYSEKMVILTVVASAPSAGSFRPSYCGTDKSEQFNISAIDYTKLAALAPITGAPTMAAIEANFELPWIDHIPGWLSMAFHPSQNMPRYGREFSTQIGDAALMLNLNFTNQEKETLAIRFIQLGIDLYGIIAAGGINVWPPDGGHASGRKLPILMAGHLLGDTEMFSIGQRSDVSFGEDAQTFFVSQTDVDNTNSPSWEPDERGGPPEAYTPADIGLPDWGIRHTTHPFWDNKAWTANYRTCCTANAWSGIVLTTHIIGLKTAWNHDALFEYQDRYMGIELAGEWTRAWSDFQEGMWDTYRASYP